MPAHNQIAEYRDITNQPLALGIIIERGIGARPGVKGEVLFQEFHEGWEPAGSMARYTVATYRVTFQSDGATHGKRFLLTLEGYNEAKAYFERLTTAETI